MESWDNTVLTGGTIVYSVMTLAHQSLPSNPDELRALTTSLQAEVYHKSLMIEKLRLELAAMRRARFGRSSEKLDHDLDQLELRLTELVEGLTEPGAGIVSSEL